MGTLHSVYRLPLKKTHTCSLPLYVFARFGHRGKHSLKKASTYRRKNPKAPNKPALQTRADTAGSQGASATTGGVSSRPVGDTEGPQTHAWEVPEPRCSEFLLV